MTGALYALYYAGYLIQGWDDEAAHELAVFAVRGAQ